MSPFLFLLAMEVLNNMIKITNLNEWLKGFDVARTDRESLEVTHLQYVNDTEEVCDAEEEQIRLQRMILVLLEGIFVLHRREKVFCTSSMMSQIWRFWLQS